MIVETHNFLNLFNTPMPSHPWVFINPRPILNKVTAQHCNTMPLNHQPLPLGPLVPVDRATAVVKDRAGQHVRNSIVQFPPLYIHVSQRRQRDVQLNSVPFCRDSNSHII